MTVIALFLEDSQEPPVPWSEWISIFEQYLNDERFSEEDRAVQLRLYLGREGRLILGSLPGRGLAGTYEEMVNALTAHYDRTEAQRKKKMSITTVAAVGGAIIGGVGAVVAAPFVLAGIGFTSTGIAAGSWAASMMSSAAIANGGGVAAGSMVALLQSAGAAGLSATASAVVAGTGAVVGGATAGAVGALSSGSSEDSEDKKKSNK